jgi:hypothetical protein
VRPREVASSPALPDEGIDHTGPLFEVPVGKELLEHAPTGGIADTPALGRHEQVSTENQSLGRAFRK